MPWITFISIGLCDPFGNTMSLSTFWKC